MAAIAELVQNHSQSQPHRDGCRRLNANYPSSVSCKEFSDCSRRGEASGIRATSLGALFIHRSQGLPGVDAGQIAQRGCQPPALGL
jgi:hypothetical protein